MSGRRAETGNKTTEDAVLTTGLFRHRMAIRSDLLARYLAIGWFLNATVLGCGGEAGPAASGDTTADVTAPTIMAKFPADMQTSVPINTVIAITFSEAIDTRRLDLVNAEIKLSQAVSGVFQPVQKSSQWEGASNTLFVRPTTLLEPDRHYTVQITNNMVDLAGNRLDTGSSEGALTWRFTTGNIFDGEKPVWAPSKTVRAVADRYDTITVCWWNDDPPTTVTTCDAAPAAPAAYDPPTNDPNGLIYTVQYRRSIDSDFTEIPVGLGVNRVTLSDLVASTAYEIQVLVSDLAANQSDEIVAANPVTTPPAGRLYVANQVANRLSVFSDAGQAQGDKSAVIVTTGQTQLFAPTGIAVDPDGGYVYVSNAGANMIAAYKLRPTIKINNQDQPVDFGQYGIGHNLEPDWTIQGSVTNSDNTGLCGPATLKLEARAEGTSTRKLLYAANSLTFSTSTRVCGPESIVIFDVTNQPQSTNQQPFAIIKPFLEARSPLAFAVDQDHKLVYIANRDDTGALRRDGWSVRVFSYLGKSPEVPENMEVAPHRTFWGVQDGACSDPDNEDDRRLCGPTAMAYDAVYDKLYVVNRRKNNILIFSNVSAPTTSGAQTPVVIQGAETRVDGAVPVGIFLAPDPAPQPTDDPTLDDRRLYVTTDIGQSVLIFRLGDLVPDANGYVNIQPKRVIKGSRTMLGQPAKPVGSDPVSPQSHGPFAVAVLKDGTSGRDEAYVATPGLFDTGLTPIPNVAVFDVSVSKDASPPNTPPDRVLVNPLQGPTGMALDLTDPEKQRLYVASFHANMILVYDNPADFVTGLKPPNRIIAGPATLLDHPVALTFRRDSVTDPGELYVVNQSSHSVAVFQEGDTDATLLQGDEVPFRYLGPPDGTDPFSTANLTEMAYPTGLAIDPDNEILYVSNRDAKEFQKLDGRKIVAFRNASVGDVPASGIPNSSNNVKPTWKIDGDDPAPDKTTLKRPAGLFLIRAADTSDGADRLVVANRENRTILIFRDVSSRVNQLDPNHNIPPTWTISNSSLSAPFGLAFNRVTNDLFVSDIANRILTFNLGSLSVGTAPSLQPRVIQGNSTGLFAPHGLALDPQN